MVVLGLGHFIDQAHTQSVLIEKSRPTDIKMAPRKMKQLKQKTLKKSLRVRLQVERAKAELGKIIEDQNSIKDEQRRITKRFGEIERQCDELKKETKLVVQQTIRSRIKLVLMLKIMEARRGGDFREAAMLTHCLREFVSKERANANSAGVKNEH